MKTTTVCECVEYIVKQEEGVVVVEASKEAREKN